MTVNAILLLRLGLQRSSALVMFTGILLCCASVFMVRAARGRLKLISTDAAAPAARTILLATTCAVAACALAALAMMSSPQGGQG